MITDDQDIVCFFGEQESVQGAYTIGLSQDSEIIKTMPITKNIVRDSVFMSRKQFTSKYQDKIDSKAPITINRYYVRLRDWIVDEKVPIPKKVQSKRIENDPIKVLPITKVPKLSRKDQVNWFFSQGITSAAQIAKELKSNVSYISRLIKQIEHEANS